MATKVAVKIDVKIRAKTNYQQTIVQFQEINVTAKKTAVNKVKLKDILVIKWKKFNYIWIKK